jgi:DNA-binding CsgD family transcriptional regulator
MYLCWQLSGAETISHWRPRCCPQAAHSPPAREQGAVLPWNVIANGLYSRHLPAQGPGMADETELIAAIYDAVIDLPDGGCRQAHRCGNELIQRQPSSSPDQCGKLLGTLQCRSCHCRCLRPNLSPRRPLNTPAWSVAPGEVRECSYTQTGSFKASVYYDEFVRPQGWVNLVVTGLVRAPTASALLALTRSPGAAFVEPAEWHLLKTLASHLQRTAVLHALLARERATTEQLGAVVAAAGFAVFLLTRNCRILFANPKAEDLLRHQMGLRHVHGQLAADTPALTHRLEALARAGSRPGRAEGDIGGTLELRRGANRPPLLAHVIPLGPSRTASIFAIDYPAVAVFVVDPAAGVDAQIQRFAARFGLTTAETRVFAELVGGTGLLATAANLNITENTARTHTTRILAKTGTSRQTELIRRFFETTLPGSPGRLSLPTI